MVLLLLKSEAVASLLNGGRNAGSINSHCRRSGYRASGLVLRLM